MGRFSLLPLLLFLVARNIFLRFYILEYFWFPGGMEKGFQRALSTVSAAATSLNQSSTFKALKVPCV